ncbi:zf-C2HC5-domain-containing protein [Nadsonia fulvescens var. elongata DSM 6958]|uniref:Zf-C2HC5-domain-containing protein n=1 Tax=Nadsonia fulvescens var. elongata DSM 6958 TaxID=857566 RepID=A0A1E3PJE0_9ASCO|nr:zf-C2HC5-domain-containing protein [Nadsonia fulvescens var. elongata DSM 6958]
MVHPEEVAEHFKNLLGETSDALDFIAEFCRIRFPPKAIKSVPPPASPPRSKKPLSISSSSMSWVADANPQKSKVTKRNGGGRLGNSSSSLTSELMIKTPGQRDKQKQKITSLADIDLALKELEISSAKSEISSEVDASKPRTVCNCMGTRHPLLLIAPNCLNCGKIICIKEGMGPCTFCGAKLLSEEEFSAIQNVLLNERHDLKEAQGGSLRQSSSSKNKQNSIKYNFSATGVNGRRAQEKALEEAKERLEKLLHFQNTGAERTKIIDQASDFEVPGYGVNQWASPTERALQLKKQQKLLRKMEEREKARSGRGKAVLSIDLKGRKIFAEEEKDVDYNYSGESDDDSEIKYLQNEVSQEKALKGKSEAVTQWNPANDKKDFIKPVYKAPEGQNQNPNQASVEFPGQLKKRLGWGHVQVVTDDPEDYEEDDRVLEM